jgi:transcription elongation factor GreA
MQDDEIILTPARHIELTEELNRLTTVERSAISQRIAAARAMGDLSENFDYHDAKRQQSFLENKITGLKRILEIARITDYAGGADLVELGSKVTVFDEEFEEEIEYTIVGVMDADASKNLISNTSPVGKALLGKVVGDVAEVKAPAGTATYKIVSIRQG